MKKLTNILLILGLAALEFADKKTSLSQDQVKKLQDEFKDHLRLDLKFDNLEFDADGYAEFSYEALLELEEKFPENFSFAQKSPSPAPKAPEVAPKKDAPADANADPNPQNEDKIQQLTDKFAQMEAAHKLEIDQIKKDLKNAPAAEQFVVQTKKSSSLMKKTFTARERGVVAGFLFGEHSNYLKVDSSRPWNVAAVDMLEGKNVDQFLSSTLDISQINNDFGEFIAGRKGDIVNWFMPNDNFNAVFPRITGAAEGDLFMSLDLTPITQAYQKAWTPTGDVKFTARKPQLFDIKIDLEFNDMKAIERTWLNDFNTEGSYAYKMSFIEFLLFSIAQKAVQEDQNAMINGVFVAPTAGVAGSHINKMDGLRELTFKLVTNRLAKAFTIGEWTAGTTVAFVRSMIEAVPEEFRYRPGLGFYASYEFVEAYWSDRRSSEGQIKDYDPSKTTIPGYDNIRLLAVPYAGTSKRCVITPIGNIKQLFGYKDNEYPKFEIEKDRRTLNIFTDYKKGMHIVVAGHKSASAQEFAERDYTKQMIWFNNADLSSDNYLSAAQDQTILDVTRHKYIRTVANSAATAITGITGAVAGDIIKVECGSLTNASTIADAGVFLLDSNFAPTEVGEYIVMIARADGKFVEMQRSAPSDTPTPDAFTANDATPDVADGPEQDGVFYFATANDNSGATAITNLDNAEEGAVYHIIGNDGTHATTIANSGNFVLSDAWTGEDGNYLDLYYDGVKFYETGRQAAE